MLESSEAGGSGAGGSAFVWLMVREAAGVQLALHGPRGLWLEPTPIGGVRTGADASGMPQAELGPPPDGAIERVASGALAATLVLHGSWQASDRFELQVSGEGYLDAWLQSEAVGTGLTFAQGTNAGGIMIPASHPNLLAVGCTIDRDEWSNAAGELVSIATASVDGSCRFSSFGPNLLGDLKPELSAPGAFVVGALSNDATTDHANSPFAFARGACGTRDCGIIDARHAVASGTSMSAAMVSGAAALLLEHYPWLEQRDLVRALQAGTRWPTGSVPRDDQVGMGALDLLGGEQVLANSASEQADAARSRVVLSSDRIESSVSSRITATLALRTATGAIATHPAPSALSVQFGGRPLPVPHEVAPSLLEFDLNATDESSQTLTLDVRWNGTSMGSGVVSGIRSVLVDPEAERSTKLRARGGCSLTPAESAKGTLPGGIGILPLLFWMSRRRARD